MFSVSNPVRNDGRLSVDGGELPGPATVCQCANDTGDSAVANAQVVLTHSHTHTHKYAGKKQHMLQKGYWWG